MATSTVYRTLLRYLMLCLVPFNSKLVYIGTYNTVVVHSLLAKIFTHLFTRHWEMMNSYEVCLRRCCC